VYFEEGLITPEGFRTPAAMGFPLGAFDGNAVPGDPVLLEELAPGFRTGRIATVATCSGTDAAAMEVARRTGAIAEAMEGAAVLHAARRLRVPAIELRAISNTTGDRDHQRWDLRGALAALGAAVTRAAGVLERAN
jgi:futalosine hydrolase